MSQGNAAAAVGLANTSKQPMIGGYKVGTATDFGANGNFGGVNGGQFWNRNVQDETEGFLAPATEDAAAGKNAQWVKTTAGLAAGTTKCSVAAGVATANNAAGTWAVHCVPAGGVPAGSWFWVFSD
jgi:hypothetical protein